MSVSIPGRAVGVTAPMLGVHAMATVPIRKARLVQPQSLAPRVDGLPGSPPGGAEPFPNLDLLSPQERRVVALFALDYTNKEIARELGIHPETVKTYARRIYAKLGVHSKAGCVAMAYARLME